MVCPRIPQKLGVVEQLIHSLILSLLRESLLHGRHDPGARERERERVVYKGMKKFHLQAHILPQGD